MKLNERIKLARTNANISMAELARRVGVSRTAVSEWESGNTKNLKNDNILKLAKAVNVSMEWILTGKEKAAIHQDIGSGKTSAFSEAVQEMLIKGKIGAVDDTSEYQPEKIVLSLLVEKESELGGGRTQVVEDKEQTLLLSKSLFDEAGVNPKNAAWAIQTGNSMDRMIPDGTRVGVDKENVQPKDGDIYAIDNDGIIQIRFIYRLPGGGLKLSCANDSEYPPIEYSAEDAKKITILGRIWWWSVIR